MYALEVQADGSHDVFVWGKSIVDQVRVVDDVPAKQDRPPNRVQQVDCVREGDKESNNSGHTYGDRTICERKSDKVKKALTESDEAAEEPRPHAGKVILDFVRKLWVQFRVHRTLD